MSDGLGFGDNAKALLVTRGLSDMIHFGTSLGADPFTFCGLAGIGDLMATCASPLSRNRQVGVRLAGGEKLSRILKSMKQVPEGVPTAEAVKLQAGALKLDLPIARGVYNVLYEGRPVRKALADLMSHPAGEELTVSRPA